MTILDRRRQLQQQIAQLPDDQLTHVEQLKLYSYSSCLSEKGNF